MRVGTDATRPAVGSRRAVGDGTSAAATTNEVSVDVPASSSERLPDAAALERTWVASYPPGVPPTYALPDVALPRLLDDAARDFPDRPAILAGDTRITWVELQGHVDRLTTVLADLGVVTGDRVVVALPLRPLTPAVLFAVWRLGAVAVPVDPTLPPPRLAAVVTDADASTVVGTDDALEALRVEDAVPPHVVRASGDELLPRRLRDRLRPARRSAGGTARLAELLADALPRTSPEPPDPHAPAVLAYRPRNRELRGVVLTHRNLLANAFQGRLWVPDIQAGRERVLVTDPLHLTVPLTLGVLTGTLAAAALVLVPDPDPAALEAAVDDHQPTLWPTGPERLRLLADGTGRRGLRRHDLTSLRVVVTGGAPVDADVAAEVERRTGGARVREGYGLAEAAPLTHAQPVYGRVVPGTIGLPVTDTVATLVDPTDHTTPVGPGEVGMLLVHGPQVAPGYWGRPDATAATFRDGWLVTGDLATVDDRGVFTLVGRDGEVVRRDGELVAPRAVEAVLRRHPAVIDAVVVGPATDVRGPLRDASLAEVGDTASRPELVAAVVLTRRARVDDAGLRDHCRAHLPPAWVPDRIAPLAELPLTPAGDPARDELRSLLLAPEDDR